MSQRVSIARNYEPVEVDLWGETFYTRARTKQLEKQVEAIMKKFEEGLVKMIGQTLDHYLQPAENGDAPSQKPSEVILEKFKADELTLDDLQAFSQRLAEAENPN